jgi:S1-C subfamily serine protease
MRIRNIFCFVLTTLLIVDFSFVQAQQKDKESARSSVVKIQTSYHRNNNGKMVKEVGTATGWCWKEPTLVVTALHAVTGSDKITVYKAGVGSTTAKIEKVLKEADLALLRLSTGLELVPLQLQDADANSLSEYYVWGFPHAVFTMQGDDIRLSRSLEDSPTLGNILTGNKLKDELRTQGYPLPDARILRISSTIQPGHSGAPIMTKTGTVIGIADGGLRDGTARINWAMPANYYLPRLATSKDLIPKEPSLQVSLYSSRTVVEEDASEEEEIREIEKEAEENTLVNGTRSISKTWTASLDDILETLSVEEQQSMMEVFNTYEIDMSDKMYDIYEDFETGATITVPYGENFVVKDGWFFVCSADQTLYYDALPFNAQTYENAKVNALTVFNNAFPESEWSEYAESPDEVLVEDENETASFTVTRFSNSGNGQSLYFTAEINGPYLLITFLVFDANQLSDNEYLRQYMHYFLAMSMHSFATY